MSRRPGANGATPDATPGAGRDAAPERNGGAGDRPMLEVQNLRKHYPMTRGFLNEEVGRVRAVDGIDFTLRRGETLGLVGESGCGKSTAATTLLRLEDPTVYDPELLERYGGQDSGMLRSLLARLRGGTRPATDGLLDRLRSEFEAVPEDLAGMIERGELDRARTRLKNEFSGPLPDDLESLFELERSRTRVLFDGEDVARFDKERLKSFRRQAQMIFQDPTKSFDPRMSIGESVAEPLRVHGMSDRDRRRNIVGDLLERVGMDADDIDRYPHEFSGGQKQRIALARALVVNPEFVVADEPVSALDVSIQANILSLINDIQEQFGLGILFISHDMGVIRQVCDRVAVMYLGEIVETAPTEELFENPKHPYTQALLSSIPQPDPRKRGTGVELTGDVPSPSNPPSGCRFHTRCPKVIQPEGADFDQQQWRKVMDFRTRVRNRDVDLESFREVAAMHEDIEDPEMAPTDAVEAELRSGLDIPDSVGDSRADQALALAVEAVAEGEFAEADRQLSEEFSTVCERERPKLTRLDENHAAACHLNEGTRSEPARRYEEGEPTTPSASDD